MQLTSPFENLRDDVSKTISKHYKLTPKNKDYLLHIVESWMSDSLSTQLFKMKTLISQMSPLDDLQSDRAEYKSTEIINIVSHREIASILDVGAGDAKILKQAAFELGVSRAYALEPQSTLKKIPNNDVITNISYNDDGTIPLGDGEIDLVIIAETLHHINPLKRISLMSEIKRVLSPNGIVVIQEHAFDKTTRMHISLEVIHNFWYMKNSESIDPLYLMTMDECETLFDNVGLFPSIPVYRGGWQHIYWREFTLRPVDYKAQVEEEEHVVVSDEFVKDNLFLPWNPKLKSWEPHGPHEKATKNGQLKLFLGVLQALVTFWDPHTTPNLKVVYAGAAPGMSHGIIDRLFKGMIEWHLYDTNAWFLTKMDRVAKYNAYFTDDDAREWSKIPNVFFFSDIRSSSMNKKLRNRDIVDVKLEVDVAADMKMQSNWVEIMKPYQASLKMRLPYVIRKGNRVINPTTQYLEGNIMYQSFNNFSSSETRLIPLKGDTGDYYITPYDNVMYEEGLYYHNIVVKNVETMGIEPTEYIKDTYEYAHLLYVFDTYRKVMGIDDVSSEELATDVIVELNEMKRMVPPLWKSETDRGLQMTKRTTLTDQELAEKYDKEFIASHRGGMTDEQLSVMYDRPLRAIRTKMANLGLIEIEDI